MFFKIVVLKNIATVKHLCWSLFLIKLKKEEAPTQVFSYEYSEIFQNGFLYRTTTSGGCFCQLDKVANCSVLGICRPSLINQKHNIGWFLLKKIVHLCKAFSLHIISRNHSNTFLLINMQKAKTCSKWKNCSKGYLFYRQVCSIWFYRRFCPLLNVYLNDV